MRVLFSLSSYPKLDVTIRNSSKESVLAALGGSRSEQLTSLQRCSKFEQCAVVGGGLLRYALSSLATVERCGRSYSRSQQLNLRLCILGAFFVIDGAAHAKVKRVMKAQAERNYIGI